MCLKSMNICKINGALRINHSNMDISQFSLLYRSLRVFPCQSNSQFKIRYMLGYVNIYNIHLLKSNDLKLLFVLFAHIYFFVDLNLLPYNKIWSVEIVHGYYWNCVGQRSMWSFRKWNEINVYLLVFLPLFFFSKYVRKLILLHTLIFSFTYIKP